jgi:hypothetical protein
MSRFILRAGLLLGVMAGVLVSVDGARSFDPVVQCPAEPDYSFLHADPAGDENFGEPNDRDILSVAAAGDTETLCVKVTFAVPVDPQITTDYLGVSIGFDIDTNAGTGIPFGAYYFDPEYGPMFRCASHSEIGVERIFQIPSGQMLELQADPPHPWDNGALSITPIPVLYEGTSFTASIPAALIGDSSFHLELLVQDQPADFAHAEDCAPNGESLRSPDGVLITPQDLDGDGASDWLDNCPGLANPKQVDEDIDSKGDPCDPTPTHEYDFLGLFANSRTIVVDREKLTPLRGTARVANLSAWADSVDGYLDMFGLPPGCSSTFFPFDPPYSIGAQSAARIRWSIDVTCSPSTTPGAYWITMSGTVMSADGFRPYTESESMPLRLRVR